MSVEKYVFELPWLTLPPLPTSKQAWTGGFFLQTLKATFKCVVNNQVLNVSDDKIDPYYDDIGDDFDDWDDDDDRKPDLLVWVYDMSYFSIAIIFDNFAVNF